MHVHDKCRKEIMMTLRCRHLLIRLLCVILAFPVPVVAEDIDIFTGNPAVIGVAPNVLIILDNSANWSASFGAGTKFSSEMATLSALIGTLNTNVNVGLMAFAETGAGTVAPKTAYMRYAVRNMTAGNKTALQNMIGAFDINGDKANNAPYGFGLFE